MLKRDYEVYGFKPDEESLLNLPGKHSLIYSTVKNYEGKEKEPNVLAKVLHQRGKERSLSVGYRDRNDFIEQEVGPLIEKLKQLDKYFGEYIPPYYVEVSDEQKFDRFNGLDVPVVLYTFKVEESKENTTDEEKQFEESMVGFINKCTEFLKAQHDAHIYPLMLPDVQLSNFVFGTHMGDSKKRLYFIDQHPPFVPADNVVNGLWLEQLEREYPFIKKVIDDMRDYFNRRFNEE